jgi:C4-dicarboxylate-specific signal transduction histidine kinase
MLYSQSPSADRGEEIQGDLRDVLATSHSLPAEIRERLELFGAHVGVLLREQRVVNDLLGSIAAVPTATRIDELHNALSGEQERASVQTARYRTYLLMFAVALVALLLYAAVRLARSHAVINRVNKALHGANENLEQRVQERTHELRRTQSELVAAARQAGKAEIATNVLHNVGNVLNSVNVSAALVTANVRASKVQGLSRAVLLMSEHTNDLAAFVTTDPKGKLLPGYLSQLADVLVTEQRGLLEELMAMTKSVDHIKEIIAIQQAHAGASTVVELVRIDELVEDALRLNAGSLTSGEGGVVRAFAPVPAMALDKGRILQILVNLVGNARQAMAAVPDREPRLTLSVAVVEDRTLRIGVADNGIGIAPDNLARVFAHGYTTKKDGHGFGLHSAVVAAREMGGTLAVHSDGLGAGAAFTLEVPITMAEEMS